MENLKQMEEFLPNATPAETTNSSEELKPYMTITNLKKIAAQAQELIGMIETAGKFDRWAQDHVCTSADDIEEVYNYMKFGGE